MSAGAPLQGVAKWQRYTLALGFTQPPVQWTPSRSQGRDVNHPPPPSAEDKERVEPYLCSRCLPARMAGYRVTFTLILHVLLLLFHKLSETNASIAWEMDCCFGDSDVRDDFVDLSLSQNWRSYRSIGRRDWWCYYYYY